MRAGQFFVDFMLYLEQGQFSINTEDRVVRQRASVRSLVDSVTRSARAQLAHLIRPFGRLSVHTGKESSLPPTAASYM